MGNRVPPARSFNTVKHSNRDKRIKRQQKLRLLILGMFAVTALLLLMLVIFVICSIASSARPDEPQKPEDIIQYEAITKSSTLHTKIGPLIVINKSNSFNPSYSNLITLSNSTIPVLEGKPIYKTEKIGIQIHPDAKAAFDDMMKVYGNASNITVTDAYRSLDAQSGYTIPKGQSDHHSAYLIALDIDGDVSTHWIQQNCHKYGFVIRYPSDKSSVTGIPYNYMEAIRYVGVAHATYMNANNLCLEEYVRLLQTSYTIDAQLQINGADGNLYSVYYVPASNGDVTQFRVPSNFDYEISGDNMNGFIVTVNLSSPIATEAAE